MYPAERLYPPDLDISGGTNISDVPAGLDLDISGGTNISDIPAGSDLDICGGTNVTDIQIWRESSGGEYIVLSCTL